ncbi:MAG: lipase family protein, partial [Chitinophagales bacterium]
MKIPILLIGLLLLIAANTSAESYKKADNELLVEYELLYTYSIDSLERFFEKKEIPKTFAPIRNAVEMYEVTYYGKWVNKSYVKAKGIVFIPKSKGAKPEVAYCHGTRMAIKEKRGLDDDEQMVSIIFAADGYVSYFPFYYGLGGGDKRHIYQHAETEANAVIYMIKACREKLLPELKIETDGNLFVTGYSQGGHAAMATHKMMETPAYSNLKITASAPLAGAFDMTGTQSETIYEEYKDAYYLPYLLVSYNDVYPELWQGDIYNVFKAEYREDLRKYFENPEDMDFNILNDKLPGVPSEMIEDSLLAMLTSDSNSPFVKKMAENNLHNWKPEAPVLLCACEGDDIVLAANTEITYQNMKDNGAEVYKKIYGKNLGHVPCAGFAIMYSKDFFDNVLKDKRRIAKTPFKKRLM